MAKIQPAAEDLTAKGAAFVFRALADDDGDKFPDFGAGLAAIMIAGVRRPRAAALTAIADLSN